jgi:hypothetical protein
VIWSRYAAPGRGNSFKKQEIREHWNINKRVADIYDGHQSPQFSWFVLFCFYFILFYFLVDFVFLFLAILFCRAWSTLGENAFYSVPNANYPIPIASRHFKFDQNQMLTKSNSCYFQFIEPVASKHIRTAATGMINETLGLLFSVCAKWLVRVIDRVGNGVSGTPHLHVCVHSTVMAG